ncbi:MAG: cation:proton antiporter [Muribaculaceae bacterium]|nr:cation:proton antiporter [Muribaculaceae bacterium]
MSVESLISDLAFILILGAIVTVLFKWIKQPVVLGYIVAGFLASPNFTPLPSVTTEANIEFWAQIGIVVLLFSLGLEFSFKKLVGVGGSAVVTALIIVIGMMATGFVIGHLMGFSNINSLFLGGMLSMSSTTIIIKAFNDLGLKQQKFAGLVFAVLIVEDLFAVLMMVILSSIAINNSVQGTELLLSIAKLVFFLIIWFMVGVYALPSALGAVRRFLNNETLLIVSMGLCLGMAVFSVFCGFSLALGAFVMGSILAGTSYAERIERVTMSVKDLFGAVFFISVGMMVQPTVIVDYWGPILILSSVVIVGMIIFGTAGMLVTGQSLRVAIESGFSLTQIGEFAFIIASLGMSLGVLNPTIYPIVVAVSVLTTFTTPYFIRMAPGVYSFVERHLPAKLNFLINRYCEENNETHSGNHAVWMAILKRYLWRIILYAIILIAIILVATTFVLPWAQNMSPEFGKPVVMVVTLLCMSPFLLAMSLPTSKKGERQLLAESRRNYQAPLIIMSVFRILLVLAFVVYLLSIFYSIKIGIIGGVIVVTLILGVFTRQLRERMRKIETKFMNNLNERELRQTGRNNNLVSNLHLAFMHVGFGCPFVGEKLMDSPLRSTFGVSVVYIQRGNNTMTVPSGHTRLFPGDVVGIIGNDEQIQKLLPIIDKEQEEDFSQNTADFKLRSMEIRATSPLIGQTITTADIRKNYSAHIVAIQRDGNYIQNILDTPFEAGDILWVVADKKALKKLNNE